MSELIVFAFGTLIGAPEMVNAVDRLQNRHLIALEDAALLVRNLDGQVEVEQVTTLNRSSPLSYNFWDRLIRRIFPSLSMVLTVDDIEYVFSDGLSHMGIDDNFIAEVREAIQPGDSALFLLVPDAIPDETMDALSSHATTVLRASGLMGAENLAKGGGVYAPGGTVTGAKLLDDEESSDADSPDVDDADWVLDADLPGDDDFPGWG
jgi:uncharacterized membrane protein